jgi:basic membrane lipoprotein Med (substrate-binding protein (PBP1-ABC) superfamily)
VGFIGADDDPNQNRMKKAFIAGAQKTVPGIRALGIITGDCDNASKGREAASILIGNGADVIWHAADVTGLGAIQGAVEAVWGELLRARQEGKAILLISTELEELLNLADRIAVMFEGRIMGVVDAVGASVEEIGFMMAGITPVGTAAAGAIQEAQRGETL